MSEGNIWLEVGELRGRIDTIERTAAADRLAIGKRLDSIDSKLDALTAKDAKQEGMVRGGWFVLATVAGILVSALTVIGDTVYKFLYPAQ